MVKSKIAFDREQAQRLKLDSWFADLYAPGQRGSNDNTNGLLRQFPPKGTYLSTLSQTGLNDIARLFNADLEILWAGKRLRMSCPMSWPQHAQSAALDC